MPVTLRDRARSRIPGAEGFASRTNITDELIAQSLEKKRNLAKYQTDVGARTDIATAKIGAASRERVAQLGGGFGLQQEAMQQEGATARQRLTQAGDVVLQELRGKQALEQGRVSEAAAFSRVQEAGRQTRLTKKKTSDIERADLEYFLKNYYNKGAGKTSSYTYTPGAGVSINSGDLEDYLSIE